MVLPTREVVTIRSDTNSPRDTNSPSEVLVYSTLL